jgi:hypothetical protein
MDCDLKCINCKEIKKINLRKLSNHKYPTWNIVGRHLAFPVTITRYIPWVKFVIQTEIWPVKVWNEFPSDAASYPRTTDNLGLSVPTKTEIQ